MKTVEVFVWVSADSSKPLGVGTTVEKALGDARRRHRDVRGYAMRLRASGFPDQANPATMLVHALWAFAPPTLRETPPVERKPETTASESDTDNVTALKGRTGG